MMKQQKLMKANVFLQFYLYLTKKNLRTSPKLKENRGMFCMMGSCQECVVLLDGKKVTSCNIFVKDGMKVKTGNLNEL